MNTNEPVRVSGWAALVAGLGLNAAFLWSTGAELRQIVGALAIVAVTSIGGLEFARTQVSPVGTKLGAHPSGREVRAEDLPTFNHHPEDE